MHKSIAALLLAAFAVLVLPATRLMATVISPIGLAPGSQYELIFVTAGTRDGTSSNISDYNTFVSNEAALNPLLPSATWHAVASTTAVNANVNAPSGPLPVYNTKGELVSAAGVGIYTGSILHAVNADQYGNPAGGIGFVWTGSTDTGVAQTINGGKAMGQIDFTGLGPEMGLDSFTNSFWIDIPAGNFITDQYPLYALSTSITFVPEPTTFVLLGSALFLIGGHRFLRWRRGVR